MISEINFKIGCNSSSDYIQYFPMNNFSQNFHTAAKKIISGL
jgi:hypothetical protein